MNSLPPSRRPPSARSRAAVVVLIISLAATLFAVWREHELVRRNQIIHFQEGISQYSPVMVKVTSLRFVELWNFARDTLCRAQYSPASWDEYLKLSHWPEKFPGMKEVGYADLNGKKCVVKFAAGVSSPPAFPPGFDLAGNAVIRAGVQKSTDTAYGAATKPFTPGPGTNARRVVLGLLPLLKPDTHPGTAMENQTNIHGFIFFALNQAEYFRACADQFKGLPFAYRLLDPDEPDPVKQPNQRLMGTGSISGEWRVLATMAEPGPLEKLPQWVVLFTGMGLSFLLYSLFFKQARLKTEAELASDKILERETEIHRLNRDLEKKITERTAELREANAVLARFKAIIEATSDLVAMASLEGRTIYLNSAGHRLMEFPGGFDTVGFPMRDYYPEDVNQFFGEVAIPQAMRDGFWAGETRMLTRTGREIPVSFVGVVIKSPDGVPLHLACIARDISGLKEAEHRLEDALEREKELNRLKSNFVSMVTHEIRTPLAHILGSSDILSRYLDRLAPEKRAQHFGFINSAVQRMSALMEDVLLFSKAEAGRMEFSPVTMNLRNFCSQITDELRSATNRRCPVDLTLEGISEPARGDESMLRHILMNLLTNAVKYSPAGKPVKFTVSREGGHAVFIIQDGGMGIPEADLKQIFTPFHRGKNVAALQGTGLGLVIVKHCVERHGGHIEMESRENLGTTACVRLPLFSPAHTEFIRRHDPQPLTL